MNNFKCETCGRNMGDIDAPICHECEQAEIDALAEQGLDRWGQPLEPEPSHDDSVKFCPNCERPNQFGDLCLSCQREEQEAIDAGERWHDEREGNGYPFGTIGAETR